MWVDYQRDGIKADIQLARGTVRKQDLSYIKKKKKKKKISIT